MGGASAANGRRRLAAKRNADGKPKSEVARGIADEALEELADSLEAGASDQLKAFLGAMGRFHHYSVNNLLLILSQWPTATRVAGFHTWKSLGRSVKKGEKGIVIIAPMAHKSDEPEVIAGDGEPRRVLRFRAVHVFDVSQTEGEPLPEIARVGGDPGPCMARLEAAVTNRGISLQERDDLGGADGESHGGTILLHADLEPAERFSVLAHELAHEMLHNVEGVKRPSKTVRETEAEAVANVVCSAIGLETGSAAADYIRLYEGDTETLAASLDRIQRTACEIIDAVLDEPKTQGQPHRPRPPDPRGARLGRGR